MAIEYDTYNISSRNSNELKLVTNKWILTKTSLCNNFEIITLFQTYESVNKIFTNHLGFSHDVDDGDESDTE